MENKWYENQNQLQGAPYPPREQYQPYYQPAAAQRERKQFGFGQLVACSLIVAVLCCCLTGGMFLFFGSRDDRDSSKQAVLEQDSVVVESPVPDEDAQAPAASEEAKEKSVAETPAPFKPDGTASKRLTTAESAAVTNNAAVDVVQRCMASAVGITTKVPASAYYNVYSYPKKSSDDASDEIQYGSGSGIILTQDGYIVTCEHVVSGGQTVYVCLQDGTEYQAQVVGKDAQTDVAILKVDAKNLPAATLGFSKQTAVGENVFAVGNPLGEFICSVSTGIVSGLDRTLDLDGLNLTLMQTDAAVNPGNSGGGLFNARGELIGIINAKTQSIGVEGLGFAIPIDSVKTVIADLMDLGYVTGRPYMGVSLQDIYVRTNSNPNDPLDSLYQQFGFGYTTHTQITEIVKGSAADKAGLKENDIILALDDKEVTGASDLTSKLYAYKVGDVVTITVLRGTEQVDLSLTLGEREA